jgi:hypothetical protein
MFVPDHLPVASVFQAKVEIVAAETPIYTKGRAQTVA